MTDIGTPEFDEAVRMAVREVLRSDLTEYFQLEFVRPTQIEPVDDNGNEVATGLTLRVDTDGVVRFLP